MKMNLHIKKSSLRMAKILYYGGLAVMALSPLMVVFVSTTDAFATEAWLSKVAFSFLIPGFVMGLAGGGRLDDFYRCPQCGASICRGRIFRSPSQFCGNCGIKVNIVMDGGKNQKDQ